MWWSHQASPPRVSISTISSMSSFSPCPKRSKITYIKLAVQVVVERRELQLRSWIWTQLNRHYWIWSIYLWRPGRSTLLVHWIFFYKFRAHVYTQGSAILAKHRGSSGSTRRYTQRLPSLRWYVTFPITAIPVNIFYCRSWTWYFQLPQARGRPAQTGCIYAIYSGYGGLLRIVVLSSFFQYEPHWAGQY